MKRVISDTPVPIKIWTDKIEPQAEQQLRKLATLPFIHKHIAVMPDVHLGRGATIGSVIATKGAIIPAAVGVDIGCGMSAIKLPCDISVFTSADKTAREVRSLIEAVIPVGPLSNKSIPNSIGNKFNSLGDFFAKIDKSAINKGAAQIGTLGGGNHFIEICGDTKGGSWLMLHSGSRHIGNMMARVHMDKAKDLMKQHFISLADKDLAYLAQGTDEFKEYIHDVMWAQQYAKLNREIMVERTLQVLVTYFGWKEAPQFLMRGMIDCHHNYTSLENHYGQNVYITRKGAVSARKGEYGIIPGSMGAKSFIVKGLGNPESFCSCSHGAGRVMSRNAAKAKFSAKDLADQTAGVECRKDSKTVDEIPAAYKDIEEVMANQADLVTPVYQLKQILCIKG